MRDRIVEVLRFLAAHKGEWDLCVGGPTEITGPLRIVSRDPCIVECAGAEGLDMCIHSDTSAAAYSLDPLSRHHGGRIWVPYPPLCRPASAVPAEWEAQIAAMLELERVNSSH